MEGIRQPRVDGRQRTLTAVQSISETLGKMKKSVDENGLFDEVVSDGLGTAKGKLDGWVNQGERQHSSGASTGTHSTADTWDDDTPSGSRDEAKGRTQNKGRPEEEPKRARSAGDTEWDDIGQSIKEGLSEVDWKGVGKSVKEGLEEVDWRGTGEAIREGVAAVDWKGIGESISDGAKQVDWAKIGRSVSSAFACDDKKGETFSDPLHPGKSPS